jgi:hypothetical protein
MHLAQQDSSVYYYYFFFALHIVLKEVSHTAFFCIAETTAKKQNGTAACNTAATLDSEYGSHSAECDKRSGGFGIKTMATHLVV